MVGKIIVFLVGKVPGWLKVVDNVEGVFLRVNRGYDWAKV
jgi:hypothetical protein